VKDAPAPHDEGNSAATEEGKGTKL
jgi:hypothetical protein